MAKLDSYTPVVEIWGDSPDIKSHKIVAVKGGSTVNVELQNLVRPNTGGAVHYPLNLVAADVDAFSGVVADDTYSELIARWDAAGVTASGVVVTKATMSPQSVLGVDIFSYTIEPAGWTHTVIVTSGLHGTEKGGVQIALQLAKLIINDGAPEFRSVRGNTRFIFVPCANPDGYDAKTRTNANASQPVDLNRNWGTGTNSISYTDSAWDDFPITLDDRYKGTAEFSEPETQALRALIDAANATVLIDMHDLGSDNAQVQASAFSPSGLNQALDAEMFYAADNAFDLSTFEWTYSTTHSSPFPASVHYAQAQGLWSGTLEYNTFDFDITGAADLATVCNYYGNAVIAAAVKPPYKTLKNEQVKTYSVRKSVTTNLSNSQSSYLSIAEFELEIPIDFQGIAIAEYSLEVFVGDEVDASLFVAPFFGQDESFMGSGDSNNRNSEERYVVNGVATSAARAPISLTASRLIHPTERNWPNGTGPLTFGIQYKSLNTTGTPKILRYLTKLTLIPCSAGEALTIYSNNTTPLEKVFP